MFVYKTFKCLHVYAKLHKKITLNYVEFQTYLTKVRQQTNK